jgi:hypothetical protein
MAFFSMTIGLVGGSSLFFLMEDGSIPPKPFPFKGKGRVGEEIGMSFDELRMSFGEIRASFDKLRGSFVKLGASFGRLWTSFGKLIISFAGS